MWVLRAMKGFKKITKNTYFASIGPIRLKIGQRCVLPPAIAPTKFPLSKGSHPKKKFCLRLDFFQTPLTPPPVFLERFKELFKTLLYMN